MVAILFRAFSTVVTVVVAVAVSASLGDSPSGQIWAAVIIAAVIALVEWLLLWTPKHSALARRILDPRANMIGVWLQIVRSAVASNKADETQNRFAVFWVDFRSDDYHVTGYAFDDAGIEQARWSSIGSPEFAKDGHSMTYRWEGEVIGTPVRVGDIDRTGVTRIDVREGKGRVDHVGMSRILLFDIEPISPGLLSKLGLTLTSSDELKLPGPRDRFAREYAKLLAA